MTIIRCECTSCEYNDNDGGCSKEYITISDEDMTAAGFLPLCKDYKEENIQE